MAALRENRSYGLSGTLSRGENLSVFHVKLTDSAARAIDCFRNGKGWAAHPTISFSGSQGSITIPSSERGGGLRIFTFALTSVASDKLQGTFDCMRQPGGGSSSSEELLCLGVIQKRLKVDATDDSYHKARQSMAQAEEETRSQGAIVIKGVHGRERDRGKKATTRAPGSELTAKAKAGSLSQTPLTFTRRTKQKTPASASSSPGTQEVKERPLKERLIHLLVLRPYRRSELLLRLQKDGLTDRDGVGLDSALKEVGDLSRGDSFVLKSGLFEEVQKDWPGYTAGELQLLKRILVKRLFQPQQNLLAVPQIRLSPLRETPNSSPVHQNPSKPEAYTDPLVKRRPRISHLTKNAASELPGAAEQPARSAAAEAAQKRSSLDPRRLFGSPERPPPKSDHRPSSARGERPRTKRKRKRSSEQEDGRTDGDARKGDRGSERSDLGDSADCTDPGEILFGTNGNGADSESSYLLTYLVISSPRQRQSYKQEFNQDYSEYRLLHARIDGVTRRFMELNAQLQQLSRESCKYREVHDRIIEAYHKIKKSNPNYQQEKVRCEYLHNKLAHIKKLISAYDQQQLLLDDTSVSRTLTYQ